MIRPEPQVVKILGSTVRQNPDVLAWAESWYRHELETLPHAINTTALYQGRCQVLGELVKFLREVPSMAAKL
jgi:hypothetical protein